MIKTTAKMPQAPPGLLPELAEFLSLLAHEFGDRRRQSAFELYLTGLLTEHPNKNCDTLAQILPDTTGQRLQNLLTGMQWDEVGLNHKRIQIMKCLTTEGDGALIFDGTDFPKQGQASVGVARQYSGSLGKVANCQVTVNCHYAERTLAWPVTTRLYLPEKEWATHPTRCSAAGIPEKEIVVQTKYEIALTLLEEAKAQGIRPAVVVADAEFGDNPPFLEGLEARHQKYVVDVRRDFSVATARSQRVLQQRAEELLAQLPASAWQVIRWREGQTAWLRGSFAAVRCWRVDGNHDRRLGWLIGQRPTADGKGQTKYFWSNFPAHAALNIMVEYAHRRHWVEQFHEESKTLLGWDQYQGRFWRGFHRQAFLVMLAFSFMVWSEWQHRLAQHRAGRTRADFSPTPRSQTMLAGRYPSGYR
jgi:SRSO17 transposase